MKIRIKAERTINRLRRHLSKISNICVSSESITAVDRLAIFTTCLEALSEDPVYEPEIQIPEPQPTAASTVRPVRLVSSTGRRLLTKGWTKIGEVRVGLKTMACWTHPDHPHEKGWHSQAEAFKIFDENRKKQQC